MILWLSSSFFAFFWSYCFCLLCDDLCRLVSYCYINFKSFMFKSLYLNLLCLNLLSISFIHVYIYIYIYIDTCVSENNVTQGLQHSGVLVTVRVLLITEISCWLSLVNSTTEIQSSVPFGLPNPIILSMWFSTRKGFLY